MEYPLRPPLFALSIFTSSVENHYEDDDSEWYNELRAIEAEVSSLLMSYVLINTQALETLNIQRDFSR